MRPEKKRSNKPQYGVSRARLLLKKNLGWLPGFPAGVDADTIRWRAWPWKAPGTSRLVTIDRETLRRMEMALGKLRYHFPRALPQIVEDVDDWLSRMDRLLDMLKGAIHHQSPMDVETLRAVPAGGGRWVQRFRRLRAARPELVGLLDAVAFLEFTDYRRCDLPVLEWIESHATFLARLGSDDTTPSDSQLTFCTLREDADVNLQSFLLDALKDPLFCSASVGSDCYDYLQCLCQEVRKAANGRSFDIPPRPACATMEDVWKRFLNRLLEVNPKRRRHVTRLLGSIVSAHLVSEVQALTLRAQSEESKFLEQLRQGQHHGSSQSGTRTRRKGVRTLLGYTWDRETYQLLDQMEFILERILASAGEKAHLEAWTRFLDCFSPEAQSIRPGLFASWETERLQTWVRSTRTDRQFRLILSELSGLFTRRGVHARLLRHWRKCEPISDLLDSGEDTCEMICRWGRLLEITVYDKNLSFGNALLGSLQEFVRGAPDVEHAGRLVAALAGLEDDSYYEDDIRATFAIASEDSDLAAILQKLEDDYELRRNVSSLGQHLQDPRLRRIVERWLLSDRKKPLFELTYWTQAVVRFGLSVPTVAEVQPSADWPAGYPGELREPLEQLRRATADAETIAAQILHKEFPAKDDLQREAQAIRQKLGSVAVEQDVRLRDRLEKRLENLERRIAEPPKVTPQRLANLAMKIRDRADQETVRGYVRECRAVVAHTLRGRFGVQSLPEHAFEPPRDQIVSGILELQGAMKELGLRLLLKSMENPTCDFRTEPQNIAFRETLEKKGIRMEPWLDSSFEQAAKTAAGEPYRLFFARQVDDVLLMGLRFDTCLSPHRENFFSTIANAVDINKQVVYAKTASGRVIGRCLFALTDSGTLLTYHRYAHDPKDGFEEQVGHFARELARAMNTVPASSGRVSQLVSRRWYDDGAVPCESIFDLQNADGPVRSILRTEEVSRIVERLVTVLGSEGVLVSLLGSLLFLEEFQQRKEIVRPFFDRFAFEPGTPAAVRLRLAVLARLAGEEETARGIVRSLRVNSVPRRLKPWECCHCGGFHGVGHYDEVFDLLIDCNPSIALRTLRLTRPRGAKSDADEEDPRRREILARCYRLLRPSG